MGGVHGSAPTATDAEVYDPMRFVLAAAAALVLTIPTAAGAQPLGRHRCSAACVARVKARVHRQHVKAHYLERLRAIRPFTSWLESTGACESGTDYSLSDGLRAVSPGGTYRGRYQFDAGSWASAGGHGDPIDASWLEQAYRAVRWRQMVGTGAWPVCGH